MRQTQSNRRGRGGRRKAQNPLTKNYESNGPDVKIRGTAAHISEKYNSLARDALTSSDMIRFENYLQHAEHYNRIIMSAQQQLQANGEAETETTDNETAAHASDGNGNANRKRSNNRRRRSDGQKANGKDDRQKKREASGKNNRDKSSSDKETAVDLPLENFEPAKSKAKSSRNEAKADDAAA